MSYIKWIETEVNESIQLQPFICRLPNPSVALVAWRIKTVILNILEKPRINPNTWVMVEGTIRSCFPPIHLSQQRQFHELKTSYFISKHCLLYKWTDRSSQMNWIKIFHSTYTQFPSVNCLWSISVWCNHFSCVKSLPKNDTLSLCSKDSVTLRTRNTDIKIVANIMMPAFLHSVNRKK